MTLEVFDLSLLSLRDVNGTTVVGRRAACERPRRSRAQQLRELLQRLLGSWPCRITPGAVDELLQLKSGLHQLVDTGELRLDALEAGGFQAAFGSRDVRHGAVFDNQTSGRNQGRQFCI